MGRSSLDITWDVLGLLLNSPNKCETWLTTMVNHYDWQRFTSAVVSEMIQPLLPVATLSRSREVATTSPVLYRKVVFHHDFTMSSSRGSSERTRNAPPSGCNARSGLFRVTRVAIKIGRPPKDP